MSRIIDITFIVPSNHKTKQYHVAFEGDLEDDATFSILLNGSNPVVVDGQSKVSHDINIYCDDQTGELLYSYDSADGNELSFRGWWG